MERKCCGLGIHAWGDVIATRDFHRIVEHLTAERFHCFERLVDVVDAHVAEPKRRTGNAVGDEKENGEPPSRFDGLLLGRDDGRQVPCCI